MTSRRSPSRAARRRWLGLLLLPLAACACPTPVERWDTPQATLALWQARLCHDDPQGEYACLSRDLQKSIGGYQTYFEQRTSLLERDAVAAWLFRHADLEDHVRDVIYESDGCHAAIVLEAGDSSMVVSFEREAWATATWDDGHSEIARQRMPFDKLVTHDGSAQWVRLDRPELADAAHVSELRISGRWLISNLQGLGQPAAEPSP